MDESGKSHDLFLWRMIVNTLDESGKSYCLQELQKLVPLILYNDY